MPENDQHRYLGRRGRVLVWIIAVFGTIATLLYFEQIAVIYILSTLALVLLLILVAFSDLEKVGVKAQEEAYMTYRPEGTFPESVRQIGDSDGRPVREKRPPRRIIKNPLTRNI